MKNVIAPVAFILIGIVFFNSCNNDGQTPPAGNDTLNKNDTFSATTKPITQAASRKITLSMKEGSKFLDDCPKSTVDSAFIIANNVFNSPEFQDALANMSFKFSSNCKDGTSCVENMKDDGTRISGTTVLDSLFKEPVVALKYVLKRSGSSMGKTCPGNYSMIAYYNNILYDMRKDSIPRAAKLAVNLCHEYMHQVGYCHIYDNVSESNNKPDQRYINDDVTYWVGWEAFYIIDRWVKAGKPIL